MRTLVVVCLTWFAAVGQASVSSAQSTPQGKNVCELSPIPDRYKDLCGAPAPRPSQPPRTAPAPAPSPGQAEAVELNLKGIDAYNRGDYEGAATYFQQALDKWPDEPGTEQNLQKAKEQIAAKKRKNEEEFNQSKLKALGELKGIADSADFDSASGLKGATPADCGLKGVNDASGDSSGLKGLPDVNTDSHVVDARNVPTGLPKSVAAAIPDSPAGNRVRKGFEAIADHDWKVAHAWFQDALNHDPGNAGIQRLIALAEFTIERAAHPLPVAPPSKGVTDTTAQDRATLATLDRLLDDQMNADMAKAFDDFNRDYLPKHPELLKPVGSSVSVKTAGPADKTIRSSAPEPPPAEAKANWQAFFDALFKTPTRRSSSVGVVRD